MTAATLDPTAVIDAARDELVDGLRRLAERGGPVDELLDAIGKLTGPIRRKVNAARKALAPAEPADKPKPKPTVVKPANKPTADEKPTEKPAPKTSTDKTPTRPAPVKPKILPARRPTPRATVVVKPLPKSPAVPPATRPPTPTVSHGRHRTPRTPRPAWLLPVVLVAVVLIVLAATAGIGWALAGAAATTTALLGRGHLTRLATAIRLKPRRTSE